MAIVFFVYYLVPQKMQWLILLAASYMFYAFASPLYLLFLLFTTLVTWSGGILIGNLYENQTKYLQENKLELSKEEKKEYKASIQSRQRIVVVLVIVVLLLTLGIFKYASFFIGILNTILFAYKLSFVIPSISVILPIGLSFYIFQSLGYCIDVYREIVPVEKNFFKYALYVSYFPQLLQGPIGDYENLAPQFFDGHKFCYENAKVGLQRVAWGFFKKLVVANRISLVIDNTWEAYSDFSGFLVWFLILCLYSIQLYADFSGYMDIALGCSNMLGIKLEENFDAPYFSRSIAEFWRRWHITLGRWFKSYVFYPILRSDLCNGIRKKYKKSNAYLSNTLPNLIALTTVWLLIGLWHGADWSYVAYGMYHGFFVILSTVLEPIYAKCNDKFLKESSCRAYYIFQIARTFIIVTIGYIIFRPGNLSVTSGIIVQMKQSFGLHQAVAFCLNNKLNLANAFCGTVVIFFVDLWYVLNGNTLGKTISTLSTGKRWCIYILFLVAIIIWGAYGSKGLEQFAYYKF